jgi:hypothetical protein
MLKSRIAGFCHYVRPELCRPALSLFIHFYMYNKSKVKVLSMSLSPGILYHSLLHHLVTTPTHKHIATPILNLGYNHPYIEEQAHYRSIVKTRNYFLSEKSVLLGHQNLPSCPYDKNKLR